MKKSEFQFVVDVINKEHDFYFETIIRDNEDGLRDDEMILRKFLLKAKDMGFNIEHSLYKWSYKMEKLNDLQKPLR